MIGAFVNFFRKRDKGPPFYASESCEQYHGHKNINHVELKPERNKLYAGKIFSYSERVFSPLAFAFEV